MKLHAAKIILARPHHSFGPIAINGTQQIGPDHLHLSHLQAQHFNLNGTLHSANSGNGRFPSILEHFTNDSPFGLVRLDMGFGQGQGNASSCLELDFGIGQSG